MDFLKQCPLLICVLLTSLLIPWELLKKEDDSQKAAPTRSQKLQPLRQKQQPLHRLPMMEQHRTAAKLLFPAVI